MKLLFIIDNPKVIGGGDYAQFKFAEHLAKRGHKVTVFAANKNAFFKNMDKLTNLVIVTRGEFPHFFKGIGLVNSIWDKIYSRLILQKCIRNNEFDYIIGYLRGSAIKTVKLGKKFNVKTVNFIFESTDWLKEKLGKRFEKTYKGSFKKSWEKTKKAYIETDILIPNSRLTRQKCSKWLKKNVSVPVYPGIDFLNIKEIKEENQVIYVGRLNAFKNVDIIIKALSKIKDPPLLVIVGSGEEQKNLQSLAKKLVVECKFLGKLSDHDKWVEIHKSKFMVFPSSFEGFGMPPGESLYAKKPCICSNIPIFKEVYGESVEYFKENNVEDLRDKILFLLNNVKYVSKRGIIGSKYVQKYTWKKSALAIEKILAQDKTKLYVGKK